MNQTSIEFCDFTFNPITGCNFGCEWCWAKKFSDRYKMQNNFSIPEFHPERLNERIPKMPKERNYIASVISPDKPVIFTVDMGDIFSKGVDIDWIERVFDYVYSHQEANFLFLTKKPQCYFAWADLLPKENTFIGTSLDFAHNNKRLDPIRDMTDKGYRTFVNIEPLMSRMDQVDFSGIDFVIVGALTGQKYRPDPEWHKSIKHPKIYYKKNYQFYFPELINMKTPPNGGAVN